MVNIDRFYTDLRAVNEIGKSAEGWNRLAYSREERAAVQYFVNACEEIGLETRIDLVGNGFARWTGQNSHRPVILCGSHLDTVRNGGQYDGALGVFGALEVIRSMKEEGINPAFPIEIVAFACEESSRFGRATVGSKAVAGLLKEGELRNVLDHDGVLFEQALGECGYSLDNLPYVVRSDIIAFIELHVEQGPVLELCGDKIGIVDVIAAPARFKIVFRGIASHSGSTGMYHRRDALPAAAEFILATEEYGRLEEAAGTVATVGVCSVSPGVINVVPGEVKLQVDIRGVNIESKNHVIEGLKSRLQEICRVRQLGFECGAINDDNPVFLSSVLNNLLCEVCSSLDIRYRRMRSGAGHDAMNLAHICPTALIFVPSKNGISHNPCEFSDQNDIEAGLKVMYQMVIKTMKYYDRVYRVSNGNQGGSVDS